MEMGEYYRKEMRYLRACAKNLNLNDCQTDQIFKSCDKILRNHIRHKSKKSQKLKWCGFSVLYTFLSMILVYILLNVHQPTSSIVLRNVQGLIYPGLKVIRHLSVPVIRWFPYFTEFYDETCLLENPFFHVTNMECWPCQNLHSVLNLTNFDNKSIYESGMPYIVKSDQKPITLNHLKQALQNSTDVLQPTAKLTSNSKKLKTLSDLHDFSFNPSDQNVHITWRINRMGPSQLIRKLFPRPRFLSEWSGQSIERYVFIDGPTSEAYAFPNTECEYVFVVQGSGERSITLKPSRECAESCKSLSVLLKAGHVLWYNWWYWRPVSLPVKNATEPSVSYLNSYC